MKLGSLYQGEDCEESGIMMQTHMLTGWMFDLVDLLTLQKLVGKVVLKLAKRVLKNAISLVEGKPQMLPNVNPNSCWIGRLSDDFYISHIHLEFADQFIFFPLSGFWSSSPLSHSKIWKSFDISYPLNVILFLSDMYIEKCYVVFEWTIVVIERLFWCNLEWL